MSYWSNNGKYQKAHDYFWKKLVPKSGSSEYPEGELLRWVNKYGYRYYNDGDEYFEANEMWGFPDISKLRNIDDKILKKIENYCINNDYDNAINETIRYIMLKYSTHDKIWNPLTNRLVCITTPTGIKSLKMLNCNLSYSIL